MLGLQEPGFPVENRPKFKGLGFLSGKTHYNGSSSVPTWVRNHTADLEPLQTLVPKESLSNARSWCEAPMARFQISLAIQYWSWNDTV